MSEMYILDDAGNPVPAQSVAEWGHWFEQHKDARRVASTQIGNVKVSTVFLGLDHSFGGGTPILYETMIFGGEHDQWQDRYSTRTEALRGHEHACALARGEVTDDR